MTDQAPTADDVVSNFDAAAQWCLERGLSYSVVCQPKSVTTTIMDGPRSETETTNLHWCHAQVGGWEDQNIEGEPAASAGGALRNAIAAFVRPVLLMSQ